MKVSNLESPRSGQAVANQFVITHEGKTFFQSYNSLVAIVDGGKLTLGRNWDYSQTTLKYFYAFLREYAPKIYWGGANKKSKIEKLVEVGAITYNEDLI